MVRFFPSGLILPYYELTCLRRVQEILKHDGVFDEIDETAKRPQQTTKVALQKLKQKFEMLVGALENETDEPKAQQRFAGSRA
jgi:transcriptional/translational regulatory protein YebC/TACO1